MSEDHYGFRSSKAIIKYMEELGINKTKVDVISFGSNGCYLFYINKDNELNKVKLCSSGLSYLSRSNLLSTLRKIGLLETKEDQIDNNMAINIGNI